MKPSFDSVTLACVIDGLQPLTGAQVQRVSVSADLQIILSAYHRATGEKCWLFDASASWARTHLTQQPLPKKLPHPLPFEQALRKYVLDGIVGRIAQRGFDRIIEVDIEGPEGAVQLIGEFTGHRSNLILCRTDESGQKIILHAAKLINHKQNRHREILPWRVYQNPPGQGAVDPRYFFQRSSEASLRHSEGATATEESPRASAPLNDRLLWLSDRSLSGVEGETSGDSSTSFVPHSAQNDVGEGRAGSPSQPQGILPARDVLLTPGMLPTPGAPGESVLPPNDAMKQENSPSLTKFEALSPPANPEDFSPWLKCTFEGISPLLEREILYRSQGNLWKGFCAVISQIGVWRPGVYRDVKGNAQLAYPLELQHLAGAYTRQAENSIHQALDSVYQQAAPAVALAQRKSTLEGTLQKSIRHYEHALRQVRQGLGESGRAGRHRRYGELLFAHLGDIPPGAESVTLQDFYTGEDVAIALDKNLSPSENAAHYFERAKHSEAGHAALETRQSELETKLQQNEHLLQRVQSAASLEELREVQSELQESQPSLARQVGYGGPGETALPQAKSGAPQFEGHRIKTLHSPEGYLVLVGENATSNDYLVRRVMAPNDWWLHVRGVTSAHAVVRSGGNPQKVPQGTLLFAARQVVQRSAAKHAGYAAVDYTLGKYVRKPRKAPPGSVHCEHEKTLHLMKEEA